MRIAVVGAGAMGSLFGGALAAAGQDVWLVDVWREHVVAIRERGLIVEKDGNARHIPVHATADAAEVGPVDLVLIFTKYVHTAAALAAARPLLKSDTLVLTLQNGIGNVDLIAQVVPPERILYGLTTLTSDMKGPGHIVDHFVGAGESYFWPAAGEPTPAMQAVADAFNGAGIRTFLTPSVRKQIWKKLIINGCLNTLTALTRLTVGDLYDVPEARQLCEQILAEIVAVAQASGVDLSLEEGRRYLDQVVSEARRHKPSMLVDVLHARRTEIESLNGAVVREGRRLGVATPVNAAVTQLVHTVEQTYAQRITLDEGGEHQS